MEVDSGKLDKRIYIYIERAESDAQGFKDKKEKLFTKAWASINSVSGTQIIKSGTDFEDVKKRFLVRHNKKTEKINHDMFIKFKKERYDVKYANNYNESDEYIEILAEKVIQ